MIKLMVPNIPEESIANMLSVVKSGNLVQGEFVRLFERQIETILGVKHAVLVSSGTAALHLALIACDISENDEVVAPAFTFPATTNVIELVRAKTVLVDITVDDYCIDPSLIENKITKNTKAIMPVHEFGQSAQVDIILEISRKYNLRIIEDAACAFGAKFGDRYIGTIGDVGCFSLHPRKAITTGEGGVLVTNNDEIASKARAYRNHGIVQKNGGIDFAYAGFNYRITDFQAALGLTQLNNFGKMIENRISVASHYNEFLSDCDFIAAVPQDLPMRLHTYQSYHVLLSERIDRRAFIKSMRDKGVETNYGAYAINCLEYYQRKYSYKNDSFPNATKAYMSGLALPIGAHIVGENQIREIVNIMKSIMV